tara:strand:- start:38 stop:619 length:582 start_codon:yes stop_codon:yes gene_type:complete
MTNNKSLNEIMKFVLITIASVVSVITFAAPQQNVRQSLFVFLTSLLVLTTVIALIQAPIIGDQSRELTFSDMITKIYFILPLIPITLLCLFMTIFENDYQNLINSDTKPDSYEIIKNINLILFIIVLIVIYSYLKSFEPLKNNLSDVDFNKKSTCTSSSASVIYLFTTLTYISSGFMYVILKYFSTDGYTNLS